MRRQYSTGQPQNRPKVKIGPPVDLRQALDNMLRRWRGPTLFRWNTMRGRA